MHFNKLTSALLSILPALSLAAQNPSPEGRPALTQSDSIELSRYFSGVQDSRSALLMASAADSIDKYRKGDFEIKVIDATSGRPVKARVRFKLSKHKFRFGACMYGVSSLTDSSLKASARQAVNKIFNTVTVCDYFSPKALAGMPMIQSAALDIEFARINGKNMRFHAILYNVPVWIDGTDITNDECWDLFESRLRYVSKNYSDIIDEYDVINEFISGWHFNRRDFFDNNPQYPQLRFPDQAKMALDLARHYLPDKKLVVLETTLPSVKNPVYCEIVDFYRRLVAIGGDFDYVGYQAHFYSDADYRFGDKRYGPLTFTMGEVSDGLDMLGSIGKPVVITEFNGPSRRRKNDGSNDYPGWTFTDAENADWQINFYRLAFSKPYIQEITRWFLVDGLGGMGLDAGVIDRNGVPKNIYDKLDNLINTEWSTDITLKPTSGTCRFRGFYGQYEVSAQGYDTAVLTLDEGGRYVISLSSFADQ